MKEDKDSSATVETEKGLVADLKGHPTDPDHEWNQQATEKAQYSHQGEGAGSNLGT